MSLAVAALLAWSSTAARADGTCGGWRAPEALAELEDGDLVEASGAARSPAGDFLWAHNDKGDDPRLFAVGLDGGKIGRVDLLGATHEDWEDIAAGPCDAACSCLYVGDIGDNDGTRAEAVIWRVAEPSPFADQTAAADALRFVYPDGPHDAEALLVDPISGEIFVVTRSMGLTGVYAFPEVPAEPGAAPATLVLVTTLDLTALGDDSEVTAGDVSPDGDRVALRTNGDVVLYEGPAGGGVRGALATEPVILPSPDTVDGEAITFSRDGRSVYLVDEGVPAQLWEVSCAVFTEGGAAALDCTETEEEGGCGCGGGGSAAALPLLLLLGRRRRLPS